MSIASRINEMTEHLRNDWDGIDKLGLDITEENSNDNLDKNIENIAPVLGKFYNQVFDKTNLSKNGVVGRTTQNHTIPVEYTRVDYIESSGTQYIDTGVKANQDTITDVTLEINQFTEDYNVYFGSSYQFSSQAYELMSVYRPGYGIDPSIANTYNNGYVYTDTISTNTKYNIRKEKNVAYLDGNIIAEQEYEEFETPVNMYIFATNSNGNADYKSSIKLYKMTISDGTNTIRNFIPCYRKSDNVVGLYDIVNNVFYTNQGTGVFTYGNIIAEPSPDCPLEIKNLSGDVEYKVRGQGISEIFPLSLKSRNLFDKDNANVLDRMFINAVAGNIGSNANATSIYIPINPNTTYCVSKTRGNRFAIGYSSTTPAVNVSLTNIVDDRTKTSLTSASASNSKYLVIYISLSDTETLQEILDSIMINEGSTVASYEPYYDIELCNISDYKDRIYSQNGKFYLEKKTGKVVLDGSRNWTKSGNTNIDRFVLSGYVDYGDTNCFSNYFENETYSDSNYNKSKIFLNTYSNTKRLIINFNTVGTTSLSNFKTWLSTHNTVVYYVLATPTTTEITQENYPTLYSQLQAIQEFLIKYKINKEFLLNYSSLEIFLNDEIQNPPSESGIDWSTIGYDGTPEVIKAGYNYAKSIYDSWNSTTTSMSSKYHDNREIMIMPLVDTSKVTDMDYCFYSACSFSIMPSLNTSKVTSMKQTFRECRALQVVPPLNTGKVTTMQNMFSNCYSLKTVPLFDTSSINSTTAFSGMFNNCIKLTDASLDNILQMCVNAARYQGTKTLYTMGIINKGVYPVSRIEALPHYQDFIDAGWKIGY